MPPLALRRPLTAALLALSIASAGIAAADAATFVDPPPPPPVPDVQAIVAQARLAARQAVDESALLALGDDLSASPASLAFVRNEFGAREIVKNAPYTAEAVTEIVQTLPDGNRIVRKGTVLLARDGAGRTRQERRNEGGTRVFIVDPIDGRNLMLDENARTVVRLSGAPLPPEPPRAPTGAAPAAPAAPPAAPAPPAGIAGKGTREVEIEPGRVVVRRRTTDNAGKEDVQVEVIRIAGAGEPGAAFPTPPVPPLPPLTLPLVPREKGETVSLGSREFDGVKADGTRTSYTIPAGKVGNEKPLVITSERWFSPELHVVVHSRTSDPRAGETTYRLTNIKRAEPSAELFKVPADYRVRGEPARRS